MTQEEIVHVPMIVQQNHKNYIEVGEIVDVHVPQTKEEIVHIQLCMQMSIT